MKLFKVVTSSNAEEFERLVNEAMNDGYIFTEGMQTLIVNKDPVSFQFVRNLVHKDFMYAQAMAKNEGELKASIEFHHVHREELVQGRLIQKDIEEDVYKQKMKRLENGK